MRVLKSLVIAAGVAGAIMVIGQAAGRDVTKHEDVSAAQAQYSVGDFAVSLAQSLRLTPPVGKTVFTPESASWALWQKGIRIQADAKKPLTEDGLTSIMGQLGLNLVPSVPGRRVTAEKAGATLAIFINSDTIDRLRIQGVALAGNGGDDFNNGNGKGGKFKRKSDKSPSTSD